VGKVLHVVIGLNLGGEQTKVVYVTTVPDFGALHDLARKFHVESCVVDIGPEEHSVREFQKKESYLVYACRYMMDTDRKVQDDSGVIKLHKTRAMDNSHRIITERKTELPRRIDDFAVQMCNTAKVLEITEKDPRGTYRYRKLGPDHYRSAFNYFLEAIRYVSQYPRVTPWEKAMSQDENEYTPEVAFA
jgi:hypothetical protein